MALPWDPMTGNATPGLSGVLTNPIQNPLDQQNQAATIAAMAKDREARARLERMLMRAATLREEPLNAQGPGPLGARQGVGPGGWAVTIGDLVAGLVAKKARENATTGIEEAQSQVAPATQDYVRNFLQGRPGGLYGSGYGRTTPDYVPQGSVLSLPLSY